MIVDFELLGSRVAVVKSLLYSRSPDRLATAAEVTPPPLPPLPQETMGLVANLEEVVMVEFSREMSSDEQT